MKHITDEKGKWIGHVDEREGMKTYTDATGKVTARVMNDKTYSAKGEFKGSGDQGMRFVNEDN